MKLILQILLFLVVLTYDFGNHETTRLVTKVIDLKPTTMKHYKTSAGFVYNFENMRRAFPKHNFLALKNVTDFRTNNETQTARVLPTLDYQAVYIYVYEGSVFVRIQMCDEGHILDGGSATQGWNLVALDFPRLIRSSYCRYFSMDKSRPLFYFNGSAHFSVWKAHEFYYFIVPADNRLNNFAHFLLIIFGICSIIKAMLDNYNKLLVKDEKMRVCLMI
ncbi:uncharacterized protein CELE_C36B7.4 [Caenorhabditis elegans]|uniref:Uncharacterized protein n=1 Tax=Caenorhabditis elegans TaxID=6239 RepID=Q966Q1_CAEEL|nr:Uncharacterized protein CELE_C36B7.4 [Caenorhabditis elegans]CCD66848.1 Uncharacterized protein CELE_C36B7.4 [Caenorhabditis elegans]|eukprot:NP_509193.2 Uncharacterized protein CELE_C36B7.4 [Caenorhabditis elegans]